MNPGAPTVSESERDVLDAVGSVGGTDAASHGWRARLAAFVIMSAPEFLTSTEAGAAP